MMKEGLFRIYRILVMCFLVLPLTAGQASALQVSFVARLANFEGIVPSLWSKIALDKERTEVFTLNPRQRDIRIFNEAGMEIFGIGDNVELSGASDLDLDEDGNIYLLFPNNPSHKLLRLDYKGEPLDQINLKDVPEKFLPFKPDRLQYLDGRFYLADSGSMNIIVIDTDGNFQHGYHIKEAMLQVEEEFASKPREGAIKDKDKFESLDLAGFCVDHDRNMYFTISSLFSAFKLSADGKLQMFGKAGSGPGKFGVVAGIATDSQGYIYVTDRLRSVVMIFDGDFQFITEFGFRGLGPSNLIVPDDVAVDDANGYIYVSQAANRGVSVFRIISK